MHNYRIIHLVNMRRFGGVEQIISETLLNNTSDNSTHHHYIINTDHQLSAKLQKYKKHIIFAGRLFQWLPVKLPAFLRKRLLSYRINALKPDYIIIWNQTLLLKNKPAHSKLIYYDHGAAWELTDNEKTRAFFRQLTGSICVCNASAHMLNHRFRPDSTTRVLKNRITLPANPVIPKPVINGEIVIGCAARMAPLKALGLMPLITQQLLQRGLAVKCLIAGDGEEKLALQQLIARENLSRHITLCGFIDNMSAFYQQLHIYISPSAHETCSLSCMEAMAHGVPVIAAHIDGQAEIIQHGVSGLCITPGWHSADYCAATAMASPFSQQIYYPQTDSIAAVRLLHPARVAEAILYLLNDNYPQYQQNALLQAKNHFDARDFLTQLDRTIALF